MMNGNWWRMRMGLVLVILTVSTSPVWAVDTTPPTAPGQPIEGSVATGDLDYISQGLYTVSWTPATDPESGVTAYELQEKIGSTGTWTTLSSTISQQSFMVQGRLTNTRYFYHVRAKNGAGLLGTWSPDSDGILIDTTPPSAVTVTDDGNYTNSTTTLHATWTASTDAESGITDYQYMIRQDSTSGTIIVPQTSAGLVTQLTKTGLAFVNGKTYYIGISPVNGAGTSAIMNYSNGITVDTVAPTVTISAPANGASVSGTSVSVNATVVENNSMGTVQFKLDGANLGALDGTSPYGVTWDTTTASNGSHTLTAVAQDSAGNIATSAPITVTVSNGAADTTPPSGTVTINAGAASTKTTAVTLTLSATDNSGTVSQMQFSNDGTAYSAAEAYATTKSWTLTTGDGTKTVYAKFKDAAGNWSTAATDTIALDTTAPTVSLTAPTSGATVSGTVAVTATASDSVGVAGVQFKLDSANLGGEDTTSPYSVSWDTTTTSNGSHTLTAVARDAAGNTTTASSLTVSVTNGTPSIPTGAFLGQYWNLSAPTSSPSVPSTSPTQTRTDAAINFDWGSGSPMAGINTDGFIVRWQGNWSFTTSTNYQFTATADDGIRLYLDGTLLINQWKDQAPTTYTTTVAVTSGTHLITVEYYENAGGAVAKVNWQVAADTTAPIISAVSASGITTSGASVTWTTNEGSTSQIEYGLTTSYGQSTTIDATLATSHSVSLSGLTSNTLYHYRARSKDAAGNEAIGADATFTTATAPDTTPPTGSIIINAGAASTNNTSVTLTLSATDNSGTVSQMRFSNDGTTFSTAEAYATTKTWAMTTGDGTKTVYAKFADPAGNWSTTVSDTITLDTTPPVITITSPTDGQVIVAPMP